MGLGSLEAITNLEIGFHATRCYNSTHLDRNSFQTPNPTIVGSFEGNQIGSNGKCAADGPVKIVNHVDHAFLASADHLEAVVGLEMQQIQEVGPRQGLEMLRSFPIPWCLLGRIAACLVQPKKE